MIRTQQKAFYIMLGKIIEYIRKNGGNRDTYILDKLTDVMREFIKVYGNQP